MVEVSTINPDRAEPNFGSKLRRDYNNELEYAKSINSST